MAFVNYNNKEITVKIVYYGPALSGKTTCLKYIYTNKEFQKKGKLITLDTDGDRTLFFDFLPIEIGQLGDYSIKMQLYTVPGQVSYDATRKLVLQGADGVVFVADSQVVMQEPNIESFENLKINLKANNISYGEIPIILQYNKRDLKEILPIDNLNEDLNPENRPFLPTIATTGENIHEGLHNIMKMVIIYLKNKLSIFQRDKTVMFSREEITSTSREKKVEKSKDDEDFDLLEEDTEKEDIFELSGSLSDDDQENKDTKGEAEEQDDDIFNLDDHNILENLGITDDKKEVKEKVEPGKDEKQEKNNIKLEELENGLKGEQNQNEELTALSDSEIITEEEISNEDSGDSSFDVKNINIPLDIEIPKGKDQIKVNVNLSIIVKRK